MGNSNQAHRFSPVKERDDSVNCEETPKQGKSKRQFEARAEKLSKTLKSHVAISSKTKEEDTSDVKAFPLK